MKICLIVATDKEGGIGKNNRLPWSIKEDMKYFKTVFETILYDENFFQIFNKNKIKLFILEII